jgi:5-(carboxyamino)imidazole ribonucleotide mutase
LSDASNGKAVLILGSPADQEWAARIVLALERLGVESERHVASAHKTPGRLLALLERCESSGSPLVYVTIAGRSNALSGFVDAQVTAPVIACPPGSQAFGGMDILSSLRMPRGVAPLVVLEPENAALAVAKIFGLASPEARRRVDESQAAERSRLQEATA